MRPALWVEDRRPPRFRPPSELYQPTEFTAPPGLLALSIDPISPTVVTGQTGAFVASGALADGTLQNMTSRVTGASATASVATINAAGVATAAMPGTTKLALGLEELPSAIGIPDPKSGRSSRAPRTSRQFAERCRFPASSFVVSMRRQKGPGSENKETDDAGYGVRESH